MYICKYCGKEFFNHYQLCGHIGFCKMNPNRRNKDILKKIGKKSGETLHKKWEENNPKIYFKFICTKCGNEFVKEMTQSHHIKN